MAEAAMLTGNEISELTDELHGEALPAIADESSQEKGSREGSEYVTALNALQDSSALEPSSSDSKIAPKVPAAAAAAAAAVVEAEEEYMTSRRRQLEELRSKCRSEEEYEIEKSRPHWTLVGHPPTSSDLLYVENKRVFQVLLRKYKMSRSSRRFHARWERFLPKHEFFRDYGDTLAIGPKLAEGGQAEILEATLDGTENCVVKVYKSHHSLTDLQRQWTFTPHGETLAGKNSSLKLFRNKCCFIKGGTLLKDGRFAFVMKRYWGDLRKLIDLRMLKTNSPFPFRFPIPIMLEIAIGMKDLHKSDILHRDLKASNVLVGSDSAFSDADMNLDGFDLEQEGTFDPESNVCRRKKKPYRFHCYIADFESSKDCLGTGFWRAPEILRSVRSRDANRDIWTRKVDVYSYAMTSYEILTGGIPLENFKISDYDAVVVRGERPPLPDFIDGRIKDLLRRCWHLEPSRRPTFVQIVKELEELRRSEPSFFFTNHGPQGVK